MLADRNAIAELIPHAGAMCLLDGVLHCDAERIRCVTGTHLHPDNPLRTAQGLPALCGIEYAAQAMAIHGGLSGQIEARPRAGYLASVRDVSFHCERLDTFAGELIIEAQKLMGDEARVIYRFSLHAAGRDVLSGRATVILDTGLAL
jgi:predicted hotdog family 3-hydroxylacyl-ACP dehydratase